MASELRVDTLKDASGANSVGLSYVANGSAKCWCNFNGTGTVALRDSLNVGSITDNGTGNYTINFTNNMANANYSFYQFNAGAADYGSHGLYDFMFSAPTTSSFRTTTENNSGTNVDTIQVNDAVHGDLA